MKELIEARLEKVRASRAEFVKQVQQTQANIYACDGAIEILTVLLKEIADDPGRTTGPSRATDDTAAAAAAEHDGTDA